MSELLNILANHNKVEAPEYYPDRALIETLDNQVLDDLIADCFSLKLQLDEYIALAIETREGRDRQDG